MPKFSLNAGDETGHIIPPATVEPGAHLLVVERELLDHTGQTVGTLLGAFTFLKIIPLTMP